MSTSNMPQGAVATGVTVAILGFSAMLGVTALNGGEMPAMAILPVAFVAVLWLIPLTGAAVRGERWVFILTLALLIFLTEANFRSRTWADKSLDWQVMLKGAVWLGSGVLGAMHLGAVRQTLSRPPALFAGLLVALMTVSAAWSPQWQATVNACIGYACFLLFAMAACQKMDERDIILALGLGLGAIVLPSLLAAPFTPVIGGFSPGSTAVGEGRVAGLTDHPIGLAQSSAMAVVVCGIALARGMGQRWLWWLVLLSAIGTCILSRSRMPVMAVGIAWAIAYAAHRRVLPQFLLTVICGGTVIGLVNASLGLEALLPQDLLEMVSRSGQASEVLTMSGRAAIWKTVIYKIGEAPLLGHGFGSGMVLLQDFRRWHLNHAHNAYLQALLYNGVAGLACMLAVMFGQLRAMVVRPNMLRDTLAISTMLAGITEPIPMANIPGAYSLLWFLAAGLCVTAPSQRVATPAILTPLSTSRALRA